MPEYEGESEEELKSAREECPSLEKVIEALVFVAPEPISLGEISDLTGVEVAAAREMINRVSEFYLRENRGIVIREVAGGFAFYTSSDTSPFVSKLISTRFNPRLTRAALETLAIVAYLQPVSRARIAYIRGVHSEGVIKTLEERGLVEVVGRGEGPGFPALYGTTRHFLERFGLNSLEELPDLNDFVPDEDTIRRIERSLSGESVPEEKAQDGRGTDTEDNSSLGDTENQ
ncbi:MAG: SMC-Scp complex subunit ScpB [Actinomycetota bacterium]|nr:SMC-Scp complex subunit ScpB [Actinomycetota bacterium]